MNESNIENEDLTRKYCYNDDNIMTFVCDGGVFKH